jgi:signal transduction histidine kinase
LLLTNKAARRLLHIDDYVEGSELIWKHIKYETISSFLYDALRSGDRVEGRDFYLEASPYSHNSIRRILNFSVQPLVKDHHVTGTLIIVEDVSEKREREAKMHRIESLASLTTLAAGVAHEIKNPLGAISIHINLLQRILDKGKKEYNEAKREPLVAYDALIKHISIVNEEIERLNCIVIDFLFAVRPMDIMLVKSDINALVEDVVALLRCEFEEKKISCISYMEEKIPPIDIDERYMKQALLNLLKNAMDAFGSLPGNDSKKHIITIKTSRENTDVIISISDNGCGISEENKAKIFEPYFTTKNMGTGLGLTLVFKIIREHKGEITLNSTAGEGTTFIITLPLPSSSRKLLKAG